MSDYLEFKVEGRTLRSYGQGYTDERCSKAVMSGKEYKGVGGWPGPEKGDVWLDLGANIGAATLWFLDNGAKQVIAVEPERCNVKSWMHNLKDEGIGKKKIVSAAVVPKSQEGPVDLYLGKDKSVTHQVRDTPIRGRESVTVRTTTMEALLTSRVTAVKMDIEGMEASLLKELPLKYWKGVEKLCIEYHFGINKAMQDYWDVMKRLEKAFDNVKLSSPLPKDVGAKWSVYPNTRIIYCWK